jgi:hypothetical protein
MLSLLSLSEYSFDFLFQCTVAFQALHIAVWAYNWFNPDPNPKMNEYKFYTTKAFYFLSASITQLKCLQGYPFLPEILGGTGQGIWRSLSYRANMSDLHNYQFQLLYYAEIFYHSWSSMQSILPGNRTKPEMIVHHVVTMLLLISSYQADHCPEGTVILFLHNVPDIFTSTTKCVHALNLKTQTFISYLGMVSTWMYFRLYLLSMYAYSVVSNPGSVLMWYSGMGLWCLECLHIFWFYLFLQMGAKFAKAGGSELPKDATKNDYKKTKDSADKIK